VPGAVFAAVADEDSGKLFSGGLRLTSFTLLNWRAADVVEGAKYKGLRGDNKGVLPVPPEHAFPANEGRFGERIHPNHMGHRLMASELLKLIGANRRLPDLKVPALR
jgi:hypothetical protein